MLGVLNKKYVMRLDRLTLLLIQTGGLPRALKSEVILNNIYNLF